MRKLMCALLCLISLGAGGNALAVMWTVDSNGELLSAWGVEVVVGGVTRELDVEFVDGPCITVFAPCASVDDLFFDNQADADAASRALLAQVFVDGPAGNFDSIPGSTTGCGNVVQCLVDTPWSVNGTSIRVMTALNATVDSADTVSVGTTGAFSDYALSGELTWARWSESAVPTSEPAVLVLLATGVGFLAWRRRCITTG